MAYHYDHILIRYGELSLKGKNRNTFIKQLYQNVRKALSGFPNLEYEKQHDRMYILCLWDFFFFPCGKSGIRYG